VFPCNLRRMTRRLAFALAVPAFLLAGCGSSDGEGVSRSNFESSGRTWPLTVDSGTLSCEPGSRVLFTSEDGDVYSVNGLAKGDGDWLDIDAIWADDGSGLGLKVPMSDLTEAGLDLCE
jgi:hypothetical protein